MLVRSLLCASVVIAGCSGAAPSTVPTALISPSPNGSAAPSTTPRPTVTGAATAFPTGVFAAISEAPVHADLARELQTILKRVAGVAGVSATVMSAHGMWSGATGTADGTRAVTVDTQFSIASTTKSVTAAQVMLLVEAGNLRLDDLAADHLPTDLDFDTNGATIRQLLDHHSGIPDYVDPIRPQMDAEPLRFLTPAELLAVVPDERTTAGTTFAYANVNYLLLGLVVEQVTGRRYADVLRDGALNIDGVERLIYQPDERPTAPIAFDGGRSADWFTSMGEFLPSVALTSDGPAAAMASDSVSLARWWRALCAGEIVSQVSLTAMVPADGADEAYGLGMFWGDPQGTLGHSGLDAGGTALGACRPEDGIVLAIVANRLIDISSIAAPLVDRLRA